MRFFVLVIVLFTAASAYAAFSNDSSSVDIDYTGPADDQIPVSGGGSQGGSGGQQGGTGSGESGGSGAGGGSPSGGEGGENTLEDSDEVTVPVTVVTEGGGGAGGSGTGAGGGGSSITAEEILNTLKGNQAFSLTGGDGLAGWGILRISGAKARAALKARGITKILLGSSYRNKFLSRGDLTIVAASSLLENENLEEVIISLDTLSLSYKARGRLVGVFPWEYPVKVGIDPYGITEEERVSVTYPWYRFFLQTFISRSALRTAIDTAVVSALSDEAPDIDQRAKLYAAVLDTVKARFDTVEGSL